MTDEALYSAYYLCNEIYGRFANGVPWINKNFIFSYNCITGKSLFFANQLILQGGAYVDRPSIRKADAYREVMRSNPEKAFYLINDKGNDVSDQVSISNLLQTTLINRNCWHVPDMSEPTKFFIMKTEKRSLVNLMLRLRQLLQGQTVFINCGSNISRYFTQLVRSGINTFFTYPIEERHYVDAASKYCSVETLAFEMVIGIILGLHGIEMYIYDSTFYREQWGQYIKNNPKAFVYACVLAEALLGKMVPDLLPESMTHNISFCGSCGKRIENGKHKTHFGSALCDECEKKYFQPFDGHWRHLFHNLAYHGKSPCFLGFEIEVNGRNNSYDLDNASTELKYLARLYDTTPMWEISYDNSINNSFGKGLEIVSYPMSISYVLEHKQAIKAMCDCLSNNGFVSHDDPENKCGMHIHIDRRWLTYGKRYTGETAENTICARIVAIYDTLGDQRYKMNSFSVLEQFARRRAGRYCYMNNAGIHGRMTSKEAAQAAASTSQQRIRDGHGYPDSRYRCVNLTNVSTVEIRIFKGSIRPSTIIATLEFVANTVEYARKHSLEDCCKVCMSDIINEHRYPELIAYAERRDLV